MEQVLVSGVALDRDQAKITLLRRAGPARVWRRRCFGPIAAANIVVDMIIQNVSADGDTDLTFTRAAAATSSKALPHGARRRRARSAPAA